MHERVAKEIQTLLKPRYSDVEHGEAFDWVLIPAYPLVKDMFNQDTTKLLVRVPPGYPNTGPDDFFVDGSIRFANGDPVPGLNQGSNSSSGPAPVEGEWGWFSWHPKDWRPAAEIEEGDNLLTFLRGASACLRGEQET